MFGNVDTSTKYLLLLTNLFYQNHEDAKERWMQIHVCITAILASWEQVNIFS